MVTDAGFQRLAAITVKKERRLGFELPWQKTLRSNAVGRRQVQVNEIRQTTTITLQAWVDRFKCGAVLRQECGRAWDQDVAPDLFFFRLAGAKLIDWQAKVCCGARIKIIDAFLAAILGSGPKNCGHQNGLDDAALRC